VGICKVALWNITLLHIRLSEVVMRRKKTKYGFFCVTKVEADTGPLKLKPSITPLLK
jgi:hypothetical protein